MSRSFFLILILLVVAALVAVASGFLHVEQTREAQAPSIKRDGTTLSAEKGVTPAFEVQTGSVEVGAKRKDVEVAVPTIKVQSPQAANESDAAAR